VSDAAYPPAEAEPAQSYADLLAAVEARRKASDDLLLDRMALPLTPMNPDSGSWGAQTD
jgi:hypothetical protein